MSRFSVWAPGHDRVDVVLGERRVAMAPCTVRQTPGWWAVDVDDAGPGTRYRFAVDGGDPHPDPRSGSQPDGIEGPSEVVDHGAFAWTDAAWRNGPLASAVVYECHVGTFTPAGTFDGVVDRLDHLVDLGVTAIELLPVAEFGGDRGWGYDGVLLWAPHHAYGGPDGLKRLVDAAHGRGIAVVLDVVYNHLGPAGNHLAEFGPYFTDRYSTPWGSAVNVDGDGSDEVRRFIIDNACMWLSDYHIDGLRLDAVHAVIDQSALHWLEELAADVEALSDHTGREYWLIAESDRNDPRLVQSPEAGGFGLDATWLDDFHHAVHAALTGERDGYYLDYGSLALLARTIADVYTYGRHWSPFRNRHHGKPAGSLPGTRFVACVQNHDQIGNRAVGERLVALVGDRRAKIAAALVLTAPFVPMLFQGEEWGASTPWQYFTDHRDPDLGRAVSEGRRREFSAFGWSPDDVPDPQDPATRDRSVLDWEERTDAGHAEMLAWHRDLIALRRAEPELTDGRRHELVVDSSDDDGWLRLRRGRITVALNLASESRTVAVGVGAELLATSDPTAGLDADGAVVLPADSVVVLGTARGAAGPAC